MIHVFSRNDFFVEKKNVLWILFLKQFIWVGYMKSMSELSYEAKWGELTSEEVAYIDQKIKNFGPDDEELVVSLLYIIGFTLAKRHRGFVEKFLDYRKDPWVSREALHTLCSCWSLTEEYLDVIKMFIRGVDWDLGDDVRIFAIDVAGEFLRKKNNCELLQLLLQIFEGVGPLEPIYEICDYKNNFMRSCAYQALARAMGKDFDEISDVLVIEEFITKEQFDFLDLDVIRKAHQIVQNS